MNKISNLWSNLTTEIANQKEPLGIKTAQRARMGSANKTAAPACLTWIDFNQAFTTSTGKIISMQVECTVFCIAAPKKDKEDAVDEALEIATSVSSMFSGKVLEGVLLQAAPIPIEIIESEATRAVVAAIFVASVRL